MSQQPLWAASRATRVSLDMTHPPFTRYLLVSSRTGMGFMTVLDSSLLSTLELPLRPCRLFGVCQGLSPSIFATIAGRSNPSWERCAR